MDRGWSRGDHNNQQTSSSPLQKSATTPESVSKTPVGSIDEETGAAEKRHKRPVGGVAVLPPMEMKKIIEDKRLSMEPEEAPVTKSDRKSPQLDRSDSLNRKYGKRDSKILEEVCSALPTLSLSLVPYFFGSFCLITIIIICFVA